MIGLTNFELLSNVRSLTQAAAVEVESGGASASKHSPRRPTRARSPGPSTPRSASSTSPSTRTSAQLVSATPPSSLISRRSRRSRWANLELESQRCYARSPGSIGQCRVRSPWAVPISMRSTRMSSADTSPTCRVSQASRAATRSTSHPRARHSNATPSATSARSPWASAVDRTTRFEELSRGERVRVALARALVYESLNLHTRRTNGRSRSRRDWPSARTSGATGATIIVATHDDDVANCV